MLRGCGTCIGWRRAGMPSTAPIALVGCSTRRRRRSRPRAPPQSPTRRRGSGRRTLVTSPSSSSTSTTTPIRRSGALGTPLKADDADRQGPGGMCSSAQRARVRHDVEACSARQRTFLWQVSQPACSEGGAASARYLQFLSLMKTYGYGKHFCAHIRHRLCVAHAHAHEHDRLPSRNRSCSPAAPGGVDHDDSVNQRHEESKPTGAGRRRRRCGPSSTATRKKVRSTRRASPTAVSHRIGGSSPTVPTSSASTTTSCPRPRSRPHSRACVARATSAATRTAGSTWCVR